MDLGHINMLTGTFHPARPQRKPLSAAALKAQAEAEALGGGLSFRRSASGAITRVDAWHESSAGTTAHYKSLKRALAYVREEARRSA